MPRVRISPIMATQFTQPNEFFGQKATLYCKSGIRYVGVVKEWDRQYKTISMIDVLSFGPEGTTPEPDPDGEDELEDFMVFGESEILRFESFLPTPVRIEADGISNDNDMDESDSDSETIRSPDCDYNSAAGRLSEFNSSMEDEVEDCSSKNTPTQSDNSATSDYNTCYSEDGASSFEDEVPVPVIPAGAEESEDDEETMDNTIAEVDEHEPNVDESEVHLKLAFLETKCNRLESELKSANKKLKRLQPKLKNPDSMASMGKSSSLVSRASCQINRRPSAKINTQTSSLVKTRASSQRAAVVVAPATDESEDEDDDDDDEPWSLRALKGQPVKPGSRHRKPYTLEEDYQILDAIIEQNGQGRTSELKIYKWIETNRYFGRDWKSMLHRFQQKILPYLSGYKMSKADRAAFKSQEKKIVKAKFGKKKH